MVRIFFYYRRAFSIFQIVRLWPRARRIAKLEAELASGLGTNSQPGTIAHLHANGRDLMRTDQPLCWQRYVLGDDKAADTLKLWCWCEAKEPAMAPLRCGSRGAASRRRLICTGLVKDGAPA